MKNDKQKLAASADDVEKLQRMAWLEAAGFIHRKVRNSSQRVSQTEILNAADNAIRMFKIFHTTNFDHQSIQRELDLHPINALTLIGLIVYETNMQSMAQTNRDQSARQNRESLKATLRAYQKLDKDPKQAAKNSVKECWDDWQVRKAKGEKPYKGNSAFARDMLGKYEELESQAVIERWCRKWASEAKQLAPSTAE